MDVFMCLQDFVTECMDEQLSNIYLSWFTNNQPKDHIEQQNVDLDMGSIKYGHDTYLREKENYEY